MHRKKVLIISLATSIVMLLIIILSRKSNYNDTDIVGGPCSYGEKYYPIIINDITPLANSGNYDLELINFAYSGEDSIVYYHFLNNSYLESNQIKTLHKGDTITLVEQNITSGTCTPHILSVDLKKFEGIIPLSERENNDE